MVGAGKFNLPIDPAIASPALISDKIHGASYVACDRAPAASMYDEVGEFEKIGKEVTTKFIRSGASRNGSRESKSIISECSF